MADFVRTALNLFGVGDDFVGTSVSLGEYNLTIKKVIAEGSTWKSWHNEDVVWRCNSLSFFFTFSRRIRLCIPGGRQQRWSSLCLEGTVLSRRL